jgi:hypothetical protein
MPNGLHFTGRQCIMRHCRVTLRSVYKCLLGRTFMQENFSIPNGIGQFVRVDIY